MGTTTWDECADYLKENLKTNTKITCLRENQIFDIELQKNLEKYEKVSKDEMKKYIANIKNEKYEYEFDNFPDIQKLKEDINIVKKQFLKKIERFKINFKSNVFLKVENEEIQIITGSDSNRTLVCSMDERLLRRIIDRKSHWNNAEVGAHINFVRTPNEMEPDVHTSLAFFHL